MIQLFICLLFFSSANCQEFFHQQNFFINNLVKKNDEYVRPFTNEPVYGDIYQHIKIENQRSNKVFIGTVTRKGKQGYWTRYWENGRKKDQGYYTNSKKDGLWVEWMENGEKYSEIYYENGIVKHLTNCIIQNCD